MGRFWLPQQKELLNISICCNTTVAVNKLIYQLLTTMIVEATKGTADQFVATPQTQLTTMIVEVKAVSSTYTHLCIYCVKMRDGTQEIYMNSSYLLEACSSYLFEGREL